MRLIPAGAGKTARRNSEQDRRAAHPRRCGENIDLTAVDILSRGSSPQVRGKLLLSLLYSLLARLIPAGAGKTTEPHRCNSGHAAHPRRCGENTLTLVSQTVRLGSSPQVRGKPLVPAGWENMSRLIPAGAGKTRTRARYQPYPPAHPRRCGENVLVRHKARLVTGSSPQVRGKRHYTATSRHQKRLIPAGAGKTGRGRQPYLGVPAHPRRCGENTC